MFEFKLPSLGADMDEGKLLEWLVRPGDRVVKGQVVAIVDTSKAAVDVETGEVRFYIDPADVRKLLPKKHREPGS